MPKLKSSVTSRKKWADKLEEYVARPAIKNRLAQINKAEGKTEAGYIQTATRLQVLRKEVERRKEYWGITWEQFARRYIGIEKNRRGIIMKLMDAKDLKTQEAIVRVYLNNQNARAEKSRKTKAEEAERAKKRERRMSENQKRLLAWARKADKSKIERVWRYVLQL